MKKVILVFVLFGALFITHAQANKKDVKILLEVSGVTSKYNLIVDQFTDQLPKESQSNFKKDVQIYIDRLINKEVDQYAASFTQDEVMKLIAFYKSPLGIKLLQKTTEIGNALDQEIDNNQSELQSIIMKYFM